MIIKLKLLLLFFSIGLIFFSCGKDPEQEDASGRRMDKEEMMGRDEMMQDGMMSEGMRKSMMSGDMDSEMMEDMRVIRSMLMDHGKIERRETLENGVRTRTTSDDPDLVPAIQTHVRQMKKRMEKKRPIRQMDPVFREIFDHADKIEMQIEDIENGVVVIETSKDSQAVKLIQQHANRAVSEFVEEGMKRAMQPTPLPEGYNE